MHFSTKPFVAAVLLAASFSPAGAAVLFEQARTTGPDTGLFSNETGQTIANAFQLAGGGSVARVTWYGAGFFSENFADFDIRFYDGSSGGVGAQLYNYVGAASKSPIGVNNSFNDRVFLFTLDIPTFVAEAGQTYVVSIADKGGQNFTWSLSDTGVGFQRNPGGAWMPAPDAVRNKTAFALLDASVVPEPATWTMMIAGFGLCGAALRRRVRVNLGGLRGRAS